jgi:hypothetical protein
MLPMAWLQCLGQATGPIGNTNQPFQLQATMISWRNTFDVKNSVFINHNRVRAAIVFFATALIRAAET